MKSLVAFHFSFDLPCIWGDTYLHIHHSNNDQKWAEKGKQLIRPKGQGRGIMVSDFIEKHGGYLRLSNEEYEAAKDSHPGL